MKVSIIIPAYNAQDTIASTLHSVLAQSSSDWEAIVVDDGSQDDTAKIAKEFATRDRRIQAVSRSNGGEAAARNTGVDAARSDWLLFLDSDDWILPCYLDRMTYELGANPALDAVHCASARVARDGAVVTESYQPPEGDLFPILARRSAFAVHACVVRKSLVVSVGPFDTTLQTGPDWDMWQRIARAGARFGVIHEVLALYRMRPNSSSMRARQLLRDSLCVLQRGHAPDPRVTNAAPAHVNGEPEEGVRTQEYYLLSWCAGLMLGCGEDPRELLDELKEHAHPELHPESVAQCLFDAGPLPSCQAPQGWVQLWPRNHMMVKAFFEALEAQSQAVGLASRALACLKQLIRKHAKSLRVFIEDYEADIEAQTRRIVELEQALAALANEHAREREELLAQQQRVSEVESALGDLKTRFQELECRHTELAQERSEWKRKAEEHAASLNGLSNQRWVRVGRQMGLL